MTALSGTGELLRLALRRDRVMIPIWVLALAGSVVGTASSFQGLYPDTASRLAFAGGIGTNPGLLAFYGPILDPTSIGSLTTWRLGTTVAVLTGLMCILLVTRHTRAEEEAGRLELLGATVVGRYAPVAAALIVAAGAGVAVGVAVTVGLISLGLPVAGSAALGAALTSTGWLFAAVAAVSGQLATGARAANGSAVAVLGAAFGVRAVGETAGVDWLPWLSPIGWAQRVRPFADERWWVLALPVVAALLVAGTAMALLGRRDLGAGLLPPRAGRSTAAPTLRSAYGLAWRLQRGTLIGWAAGFAVLGTVFGSIATDVGGIVAGNAQVAELMARGGGADGLVDGYLATVAGVLGLAAAGYAVQAVLRTRSEEVAGRTEALLTAGVARWRWMTGHAVVAALGTAALLVVGGAAAGLVHGIRAGDVAGELPRVLAGTVVQTPAAWVFAALAVALSGAVPRLTASVWVLLAAALLLGQLGPLLELPRWLIEVSPFAHVPRVPAESVSAGPVLVLSAVAAALAGAGVAAFRRRDLSR